MINEMVKEWCPLRLIRQTCNLYLFSFRKLLEIALETAIS